MQVRKSCVFCCPLVAILNFFLKNSQLNLQFNFQLKVLSSEDQVCFLCATAINVRQPSFNWAMTEQWWLNSPLPLKRKDWSFHHVRLTPFIPEFSIGAWSFTTGKDPDAGKEWRQEETGVVQDEMVIYHHWLNGHKFEQTLRDSRGQRSLVGCSPWGCKESETT